MEDALVRHGDEERLERQEFEARMREAHSYRIDVLFLLLVSVLDLSTIASKTKSY